MDATRRVLVVEGDPDVREALAYALRDAGFDVTLAADGADGLERLRAGLAPGVVLLDLPPLRPEGESLLGEIRSDPQLAHLPVITMTGGVGAPSRGEVLAHLLKPFELDDLLALVASLCGSHAA